MRVLYLSYDGMMEPLGQSQVLQYLKKLTSDHTITLISYEKEHDWNGRGRRNALIDEVRRAGIRWHPLRYHKRPTALATSYDIFMGFLLAGWVVWQQKVEIVHARSYVPSVIAWGLKAVFGVKFIFDMRGFWPDEKVDNGDWKKRGGLYRIAKWFERRFLLAADCVVSLTQAAVDEMRRFDYLQGRLPSFEVIPTCANLDHFHRRSEIRHSGCERAATFTLGYVGSAAYSYLFDEALGCFKLLREMEPGARLVILNRGHHELIKDRLVSHGISTDCVELREVDYGDLPFEMSRMDASVFFIRQTYSKLAMAPTKVGELLGCGVPCLSNTGVGDLTPVLEGEGVGVVVTSFANDAIGEGLKRLLILARDPQTRRRCRNAAERLFALGTGVRAYARIYEELGYKPGGGKSHEKQMRQGS